MIKEESRRFLKFLPFTIGYFRCFRFINDICKRTNIIFFLVLSLLLTFLSLFFPPSFSHHLPESLHSIKHHVIVPFGIIYVFHFNILILLPCLRLLIPVIRLARGGIQEGIVLWQLELSQTSYIRLGLVNWGFLIRRDFPFLRFQLYDHLIVIFSRQLRFFLVQLVVKSCYNFSFQFLSQSIFFMRCSILGPIIRSLN